MTTSLMPRITLTDDQLQAAGSRVGVHSFPTVLAVRPRHGTVDQLHSALDDATEALAERGLISDGSVDTDLVAMLQALQRPDRELAMRLVTPDGTALVSVARRGTISVLARRIGNDIVLGGIASPGELRDAIQALSTELPPSNAAQFEAVGAPLDAMAEALSGTHDSVVIADRIRALGAEPRTAMLLGAALGSRQAFAEVVYCALVGVEDRVSRGAAAVGVFYTKRGRIIAAPSASPTGQLWTTLKPGSDHAFGKAIGQLVELSGERWGDS